MNRFIKTHFFFLIILLSFPAAVLSQHFVPVYESVYQPMNIVVSEAEIDGLDLVAGDEIGIFDTTATGQEICVGAIVLAAPITAGNPLPVVTSLDDPLTPDQDGFVNGHPIIYRFWDASASLELVCVFPTYDAGFDDVFTALGTALAILDGIYSPTVNAGPDDLTCEDTPYALSGTGSEYQSSLWTTSGDGTFDNPNLLATNYNPGPNDILNGSVTLGLTAFAFSPCGDDAYDEMVLSIQALPSADAGADDATCELAPYTLSGQAGNQASVLWSTAGDGTFDDATLLNATYTPGSGDFSNGSVVLTLEAYAIAPCGTDASDDMLLSIQMEPTASAGDDDEVCEGDSYTLSGSATDYASVLWSTSGDGTFDDASLLNATYTPGTGDISNGIVTLTINALAVAPCGNDAGDSMLLGIQAQPTAYAGVDAQICEGEDYMLSGLATNQASLLWTTAGDGSFDDPALSNATYTPGPGDIGNGSVVLTITAEAISPCGDDATDDMTLNIDPLPGMPGTPDGPTIVDIHITPTSEYETSGSANAGSYSWNLSPDQAGTIAANGLTALVTWNAAFHGFAYVKVTAFNSCGSAASDSLEVEVSNSVGLWENHQKNMEVSIIPNPSEGKFRLNILTDEPSLKLAIYGCDGSTLISMAIDRPRDQILDLDLGDRPAGIYFIRLYNDKVNHTDKIIIQ